VSNSIAGRSAPRDPGSEASVGRAESLAPCTASSDRDGSDALGVPVTGVDRVAAGARPRQAGDRAHVAPTRVPPLLDVGESKSCGSSSRGSRGPRANSSNGHRESALRCTADSWGTAETGHLGGSSDRREVHAAARLATITAVANVPGQPCRPDHGCRFLRRADGHLPAVVRTPDSRARPTTNRPRRRHRHPTAAWTAQQLRNAFPADRAARYLLHDRDAAFTDVASTIGAMQIHEVITAPRSPWQNAYVERLIGSIRRECLDHTIILSIAGLQRVLADYVEYYMNTRTHLSLGKDAPASRPATPLRWTHHRDSAGQRAASPLRPRRGVTKVEQAVVDRTRQGIPSAGAVAENWRDASVVPQPPRQRNAEHPRRCRP
jgi:Integrase core domain